MSSENPYSAPTTPGQLVEQPLESHGPRTYQRLVGQSRAPVIVLAVITGGVSVLFFIQFLFGLREMLDIAAEDGDIWGIDPTFASLTFWKLVPAVTFLSTSVSLTAIARAMRRLSRSRSTNLARLLWVENRFWWTAAIGFVLYAISYTALIAYWRWAP